MEYASKQKYEVWKGVTDKWAELLNNNVVAEAEIWQLINRWFGSTTDHGEKVFAEKFPAYILEEWLQQIYEIQGHGRQPIVRGMALVRQQ